MRRLSVLVAILLSILMIPIIMAHADEYDDITKQLSDLKGSLDSSQKATKNNEVNLNNINKQLDGIKAQVAVLEREIIAKEKEVAVGEKALSYQKDVLGQRTISYYKNMNKDSLSVVTLLVSSDIAKSINNFFYQKSLIDEDRRTILKVIAYIKDLEEKKNTLEKQNLKMQVIKKEVATQSNFLAGEVAKSKQFENELQSKIAQLSARQQQIIASKQSSLNIPSSASSGGSRCQPDIDVDPGFSPRFAFFTFGTPNRVGLNQYGAKGRADAGQNSDTILRAYYNFDGYQNYSTTINVNDGGGVNSGNIIWSGSLDDYVKRVYEVPESWPIESLKAQAIAARSYALATTNNGASSICATESCQVFKTDPKGGAWDQAVNDTAGQAMVQGGQPIKAYFSSTHGGYVHTSADIGWNSTAWTKSGIDATGSINSFDDLKNNAYDKSSPWFYCDWGSRAGYNKTAWLKSDEVADIVNVLMLAKRDGGTAEHLYQLDSSNPSGQETWDANRVKQELKSRGGTPYNSVSDISVDWDKGSGRTTSVHINGDAGSNSFDSSEFKGYFNVRAPANISIVGPLFNIEKR